MSSSLHETTSLGCFQSVAVLLYCVFVYVLQCEQLTRDHFVGMCCSVFVCTWQFKRLARDLFHAVCCVLLQCVAMLLQCVAVRYVHCLD